MEETILLIESEPEKSKALLSCLSQDYQVLTATTGNHARQALAQIPTIDVILFDDGITDILSVDFFQGIHAVGFLAKPPTIWSTIMPACIGPGPEHSTCHMGSRSLVPG
ncbi:MAG: hypothetical protein ABI618_00650 [Nitrospirota bacterium]